MIALAPRLAGAAIGLFGATWLFWAGIAFEHRPAGQFSFDLLDLGPVHLRWTDPGGPVARLEALRTRDAALARASLAAAGRIEAADAAATGAAEDATEHAQARIAWRTRTLVEEIPHAMPPASDRAWPLSVGFVRLHDAAALGIDLSGVAAPAGRPDASASRVAPSALAGILARNYGDCRADAAELAGWQAWYAALRGSRTAAAPSPHLAPP